MSTYAEAAQHVRSIERRCEDLADQVMVLKTQQTELVEALRHAVSRNHPHRPEGCEGCANAEMVLEVYSA
jgi:hypothetical protein